MWNSKDRWAWKATEPIETVLRYEIEDMTSGNTSSFKGLSDAKERLGKFAKLLVYLDSRNVEHVEEVAKWTFDSLLSDIGGQLSLYLGISVIALCQEITKVVQKFK